jgi:hypothetical protein
MSHGYDDMDSGGAGTTLGVQGSGGHVKKPLTRKEKIQEELKLLEWHKLANDAAIKASLMQNAQLKKAAPHDIPTHTEDDAKWMKKVIQQEHIKPLEVNKEYVLEYERREKENEERLTMQVERHIGTLQKLRSKLEAKADMKKRSDDYRAWNRTFNVKKQEVMLGKTLAEIENVDMGASSGKENKPVLMPTKRNVPKSSELGSVLESLDKLSELENRITSLEKDNVYERMVQSERPSADRRTVMDFKKSRAIMGPGDQPGKGPKAVVYSMRPKQKSWQVEVPGITKKTVGGRGGGKIPPLMNRSGQQDFDDEGGGTFLTGIDAGEGRVANPKLDRARKLHDASAGQKNMRTRVQVKKNRMKEDALGTRKHEQALAELNRRRNEQQIQKRPPRSIGVASKGAAAGVKTSNRHLNDFNKTKDQMKSRVASIKRGTGAAAAGGRGGSNRVASKTAPALSSTGGFDDAMLGSGAQRRMPHTRGGAGGTGGSNLTRRVVDKTPQRRSMGGANADGPSSAPAVGGVGGIRALRNNRSSNNDYP